MIRYHVWGAAAAILLTFNCATAFAGGYAPLRIVGTWSLSLDAGPYGLPGYALTGIAVFHADGTFAFTDAGDFGSLGTLDSHQIGVWRYTRDGVIARALFLSADPATGEPVRWTRSTFHLMHGDGLDHVTGTVNGEALNCDTTAGIPAAITCQDPVTHADDFVVTPPFDVPIELHRLRVR